MEMTVNDLRALGPRGKQVYIETFARIGPDVLAQYGITSTLRVAHFWAQAAHECDGFKTMEEYASGAAYEGRRDLGNTQPGDGVRYKGRGIFQLTGRANYASMGAKLGLDLVSRPYLASDPVNALKIACEFWKSRNLNLLADKNDIVGITRKINGGTNGLEDRKARFKTAWQIWGNRNPLPKPPMNPNQKGAVVVAVGGAAAASAKVATGTGMFSMENMAVLAFVAVMIVGAFFIWKNSKGDV